MVRILAGILVLFGPIFCTSAFGQLPSSPVDREIWNSNNLVPAPAYDRFHSFDYYVARQPKLAATVSSLTGMKPSEACRDFKNVEQCFLVAHVATDLNLNFGCLKSNVTHRVSKSDFLCPSGTGQVRRNLSASVRFLSPNADPQPTIELAKRQTKQDASTFGSLVFEARTN